MVKESEVYHATIKEIPSALRPRERLLKEGPEILSDIELLAIMLRTGTRDISSIDLAAMILSKYDSLRNLLQVSIEEFSSIKGIGEAKAAQIKAALELGRRVAVTVSADRISIKSPEDAVSLVMEDMRHLDREHFVSLLLNVKNQVMAREIISIGTLNASSVHPRELFKPAIKRSAASVILVHNHPSGDPEPSREDIDITMRLIEAGEIIGIKVLDHLVIGDNKFVSLKAKGII
ncbi:MAG: DNA repair protein RadC [Clostridiales bacterium]|nr:DNA repair protein RadC [Clostridiales bacterium]MCF8022276.1 DNA repair protein RadC [Clostridiales bacterium]